MAKKRRTVRSTRDAVVASELEPAPVDWLWRDRIPEGMLTVVAGKPDQGKGLFATHVASDITKRKGNVLYSAIEDDPERMTLPRLEACGANLDRVLIWRFVLPAQFHQLEERILENSIKLLVIDPLAAHLSGGVSRHSDSIREVTSPLAELAEATSCAVLIIEHALKSSRAGGDPLSIIGGTGSGLPAAARMAYLFGKDPKDGDRRLLCPVKNNLREKPKALAFETDVDEIDEVGNVPYLLYQEEVDIEASILLQAGSDGQPGRPPDKRAAAAEWLTRLLFDAKKAKKKMLAQDVYEDGKQFALSAKTLRRAAEDMGVEKIPPGGGRKCEWTLPDKVIKALKKGGMK